MEANTEMNEVRKMGLRHFLNYFNRDSDVFFKEFL